VGKNEPTVCEAFAVLADLCIALGEAPLSKHVACWEHKIDERWAVAVNGHNEPKHCSFSAVPVDPFNCYVQFNGWPAGILNPYGGIIAAGELANEATFIEAMRDRIATLK
jgi:hypothetical protein